MTKEIKRRKSPVLALCLSALVFPGAGQIYNKQFIKGIVMLLCSVILLGFIIVPFITSFMNYLSIVSDLESINVSEISLKSTSASSTMLSIVVTVIWLNSVFDAYIFTKKNNSIKEEDLLKGDKNI